MREMGASDPKTEAMRFHVQTAGSTLTAQQPLNNIARTTLQALAAVLGGTQSLHTNAYDEAVGLPTDESALVALRTQQVLAHESGVADTADPLAGSYFVEALTDELVGRATDLLDRIEKMGGAVQAIEDGWMQGEIEEAAYLEAKRQSEGSSVVVGMNKFANTSGTSIPVLDVDPELEAAQVERIQKWRESRDQPAVDGALEELTRVAETAENLLPPMKEALRLGASVGEVSDALRSVFGVYRPS
jgi:methylmalonyl-CoA mutase N-terminal domain/subunit